MESVYDGANDEALRPYRTGRTATSRQRAKPGGSQGDGAQNWAQSQSRHATAP